MCILLASFCNCDCPKRDCLCFKQRLLLTIYILLKIFTEEYSIHINILYNITKMSILLKINLKV